MCCRDEDDEPLLTDTSPVEEAGHAKFMKFNPVWKICAFTVLLLLLSLAFITELRAFEQASENDSASETYPQNICWACVGFRCAFSALATASVLWIYFRVLKTVDGNVRVENMPANIQAPRSTLPSKLFVWSLLFLACWYCFSMLIELGCGISDIAQNITDYERHPLSGHATGKILERSFMLAFAIVQTVFLLKYLNKCILVRLGEAWMALSIILAVSIGSWLTNIGMALQDTKKVDHLIKNDTMVTNDMARRIQDMLYPFRIEFCITASLVTYCLMSNSGRKNFRNEGEVRAQHGPTQIVFCKHLKAVLPGLLLLGLIMVAVLAAGLDNPGNVTLSTSFYCALLFLQVLGIGSVLALLCYTQHDRRRQLNSEFLVDRLLLWLGAMAIVLNAVYRIWGSIFKTFDQQNHMRETMWHSSTNSSANERLRGGVEFASEMASIIQCGLQSFQFESMLTATFSKTSRLTKFLARDCPSAGNQHHGNQEVEHIGRKICLILYLLMVLNLLQWVLSVVGFTFFFYDGTKDPISLVIVPLVVFYGFHSALFIHHFAKNRKLEQMASGTRNQRQAAHILE